MGESESRRGRTSKVLKEQSCKFGTIVRALWPDKPALNLAQRIGISERGAQFYIDGERKPSGRAIIAILREIDC
jgi:hypothetical protein